MGWGILDKETSNSERVPPAFPTMGELVASDFNESDDVAELRADESKGRIFPCEGCGADLVFHIGQQQMKCEFCGFTKEIEESEKRIHEQDYFAKLQKLAEKRSTKVELDDVHTIRCQACGAQGRFYRDDDESELRVV